jgi:glucose/arabinose dehydrogenase
MKYNDSGNITMHYLKVRIVVFRSSLSFFCALLSLASIIVLSEYYNNDNALLLLLPSESLQQISKIIQAAAAISTTSADSNFDFHRTAATITDVQLPGIIPNNNNNNITPPPPTHPTFPSASPSAPPPPITHNTRARAAVGGPTLNDPNLKVEQIFTGHKFLTSMAFLGPNDILVLEKNTGMVHRIVNGKMLPQPILQVPVATEGERGLLGIAVAKSSNSSSNTEGGNENGGTNTNTRHVFLYYTESGGGKDGDDTANTTTTSGIEPAGNRLYRYDLNENNSNDIKLVNPTLLLNLPASPPPQRAGIEKQHMGGKVVIGPDNNVYVGIGDVVGHNGQSENNPNGAAPDGTGGILRITQDGQLTNNPPLGNNTIPLSLYYAYGMRNTFGMDFDPITGNLWDTENGPTFGDEINLVKPGFNSGWSEVAGIWEAGSKPGPAIGADSNNPPKGLVTFGGKGVYRAPEFSWLQTIAPTALKFLNSDKLGRQYENTIFMGDVDYGRLYNFKLNQDRTALAIPADSPLANKTANTPDEMEQQGGLVLGQGFGVTTDIQVGPDDGYLYILTLNGNIYRIVPSSPS